MLAHELAQAWPELPAPLCLHSAAAHRAQYLQRPDLGRRLNAASVQALQALNPPAPPGQVYADDADSRPFDLALVVADGLSARAMTENAVPLVQALRPRLLAEAWRVAPIALVSQGRVAVGDDVGQRLGARAVVVLIGERPGLSSPDSMGLYLTWMPRVGLTDAARNCISNVRPAGLGHSQAAAKLHHLLSQARLRRLSGVNLKDNTEAEPPGALANAAAVGGRVFLTR
jgi:ethanolamine ammonia-lyase small subunit